MTRRRGGYKSPNLPDTNSTSPVADGSESVDPASAAGGGRRRGAGFQDAQRAENDSNRAAEKLNAAPKPAAWGYGVDAGPSVAIWSSPQFAAELERAGADRNIGLTNQGEVIENIYFRWLCTPVDKGGRGQRQWTVNPGVAVDCQEDKKYRVSTHVRKASIDIQSDILENVMNEYDSYTYHFRLYMMPEEASGSKVYRSQANLPSITIAESGASTIGIEDVTIETSGGLTKEAGVGVATKIMLTLKQPFGVSVLDKIKLAADQLGIRNWQKAPYYLELTFRARDPETQKPIENGPLKNLVWEWPFMIGKTSIQVNTGGSTYIINGYHVGDLASSNEGSDLTQVISIRAATVGEFFEKLEDKFNEGEHGDQYYFHVDGAIANQSILLDDEAAANRTGDFEVEEKEDGKYITFTRHTSIDRIVDSILSCTRKFQESTGLIEPETSNEPNPDKERARVVTLWRVIPETTIIGYDSRIKNDYVHRFRYLIIPYTVPTVLPLNQQNMARNQELALSIQRRGVLRKQYDYLYTGLNDQVLDFDVNFNFNWYAAIPYYEGLYTTGDVSLPGQANQSEGQPTPLAAEEELINYDRDQWKVNQQLTQAGIRSRAELDRIASRQEDLDALNPTGAASKITPGGQQRRDRRRGSNVGVGSRDVNAVRGFFGFNKEKTDPVGEENNPASVPVEVVVEEQKPRIASPLRTDYNPPNPTLSGDILVEDLVQALGEIPALIPSFRQQSDGGVTTAENIGESNRAKTLLSTMFEQAISPTAGDLLSIDLKVRGDPFWLEPAPYVRGTRPLTSMEIELRKRGEKIDHKTGVLVADESTQSEDVEVNISYSASTSDQSFYILRMFTPQEFDEDTGITTQNSQGNLLNGLYAVQWVVHEFSGGLFTQTLKSVRLLDVDLTAELLETLTKNSLLTEEQIKQALETTDSAGPRDEETAGARTLARAERVNISDDSWRRLRAIGEFAETLRGTGLPPINSITGP